MKIRLVHIDGSVTGGDDIEKIYLLEGEAKIEPMPEEVFNEYFEEVNYELHQSS